MDLIYYISDHFPYDKLICNDSGPEYALEMGWKIEKIKNLNDYQNKDIINIIDNHISEKECQYLENILRKKKERKFIFTIIDPYNHHSNNYYYIFLKKIYSFNNILFLSKYQPEEWCLELDSKQKKVVWLPYPYNPKYEKSLISFERRENKILFSGALHKEIYPLRTLFFEKYYKPENNEYVDWLYHPGYPDIGQQLIHTVIKDKYIRLLSQYKFMFLCPSRCNLEFMKYRECAYAGCVPVGKLPYPLASQAPIVKWDATVNIQLFIKTLFESRNDLLDISKKYREFFKKNRSPELLNRQLIDFLKSKNWA